MREKNIITDHWRLIHIKLKGGACGVFLHKKSCNLCICNFIYFFSIYYDYNHYFLLLILRILQADEVQDQNFNV